MVACSLEMRKCGKQQRSRSKHELPSRVHGLMIASCALDVFRCLLLWSVVVTTIAKPPCQSITVSGQTAYQPQNDAMGEYELIPGSTGSGKRAYRFGGYYLYFIHLHAPPHSQAWCISAELGDSRCKMYLRHYDTTTGTALTTRRSGTWEVLVEEGAKADVGHYVAAMNVRATCTSQAMTWKGIHTGRDETRVVGDDAGSQFGDEAIQLRGNSPRNSRGRSVLVLTSCAAIFVVIVSWLSLSHTVAVSTELVRRTGAAGCTPGPDPGGVTSGTCVPGHGTKPGFAGAKPDMFHSISPAERDGPERECKLDAAAQEEVRSLLNTV